MSIKNKYCMKIQLFLDNEAYAIKLLPMSNDNYNYYRRKLELLLSQGAGILF